jgi:hypothetical protein
MKGTGLEKVFAFYLCLFSRLLQQWFGWKLRFLVKFLSELVDQKIG